jgi:hypothetical protein
MIDKINRFVNNVDSDTIDISGIDYKISLRFYRCIK